MRRAYLILTDSGGVQEEAPSLGVPVLVLRKTTERPEAAQVGLARVIGTSRNAVVQHTEELLHDRQAHRRMATAANPYGDGRASKRIVEILKNWRKGRVLLPKEQWFMPPPKEEARDPGERFRVPTADASQAVFPSGVRGFA
jgi:UDP-N-acetylglucosamine 2-epimerase